MVSPAQAPVKTFWQTLGTEPPEFVNCAYCGRLIARFSAHREYLHVGGQPDREAWYCADGNHQSAR